MTNPIDPRQMEELFEQNEFLKKAFSVQGFIELYFEALKNPDCRTRPEAFNQVNERFFDLVGEYRYTTWDSFRVQLSRELKK